MRRPSLIRLAVFVATTVAAWGILTFGMEQEAADDLQPGQIATRTYEVVNPGPVVDQEAYERAQEEARSSVQPVTVSRPEIEEEVLADIEGFFADIAAAVERDLEPPEPPVSSTTTSVPEDTTTSLPEDTTTSTTDTTVAGEEETPDTTVPPTTIPPGEVLLQGFLFIDADGDGSFDPELPEDAERGAVADAPLPAVSIDISSPARVARVESQSDGTFTATVTEGEVTVELDESDPDLPEMGVSAGSLDQTTECFIGQTCEVEPVGFDPDMLSVEGVVSVIGPSTLVPDEDIAVLAAIAREDIVRTTTGGPSHLVEVQERAVQHAQSLFNQRIYDSEAAGQGLLLEEAQVQASEQPPVVFYTDTGNRDAEAGQAAGNVVANFLRANETIDEAATEQAAEAEAAAVDVSDFEVQYAAGQVIADQGDVLTSLDVDAIRQTAGVLDRVQQEGGLLAVLVILSAVLALYLNRFRPEFWARPRMVALLGILIVMAAGAVRGTVLLADASSWYVMPAVAFGLMTAVLFDSRIGVLMALSMAILTAVGTRDPGITVYALLATMAPIPFVSSVSTRRAFRNAAVYSALAAGVIAAATSWFFHTGPDDSTLLSVGISVAWAFGVSLGAALFGLALLQFFESAFDITTTLALLDLTDRNHEALQLLQEKAFGSFNHSLMVGTLADAAARAIGADPLLARAMAYYHDLGKTENPTMFIENQFGIANPHDEMSPEESAEVIRRHVTDGVRLARKFNIPSEVAEGIVSHHGDGIMRYFYEKAREEDPGVDPNLFRHVGHKPRTVEAAVVMLADALEASARAMFQHEEPTPDAIEKVVNRVVDEKLNDGQLSDSPVTLAQLTQMRKAFLSSLVGHYHQRIAYPNFPGS